MAPQRLIVTTEQLFAAWRRRRRVGWPTTFAECMAHPLYSRLVRAQAIGLAQAACRQAQRAAAPPAPPTMPLQAQPQLTTTARPSQADLFASTAADTDDHDD